MANNELSLSSLGIQLPYNMQAEQSVLGAALMDETILNRLITEMDPDMFYSEQNRAVYEEMRRLFSESEAVDVITLVDSLAQNGVFKGADDAKVYITRIAETVTRASSTSRDVPADTSEHSSGIRAERRKLRKGYCTCNELRRDQNM